MDNSDNPVDQNPASAAEANQNADASQTTDVDQTTETNQSTEQFGTRDRY